MKRLLAIVLIIVTLGSFTSCNASPKTIKKACAEADEQISEWNKRSFNGYNYTGSYDSENNNYTIVLKMDPEDLWWKKGAPASLAAAYGFWEENIVDYYNEVAAFFKGVNDTNTAPSITILMYDLDDKCFGTYTGTPAEDEEKK